MKIEKTIDRASKLKLYVQIYTIIKEKIESGEWPPGTQIPTEDDLCKTYDVSKVTVREAIQELAREGYLRRQQGKGTFVYPVPRLGLAMRIRLTDVLHGEEVKGRKEILEKGPMKPSEDMKSMLQSDEDVYYVLLKKYVDGEPSALEELFSPALMDIAVDDEDILYKSLPDVIEEKGTRKISRVVQNCRVERLNRDFSLHLGVKEGSFVLVVSREFFSSDGNPIAYTKSTMNRGIQAQMEFERMK